MPYGPLYNAADRLARKKKPAFSMNQQAPPVSGAQPAEPATMTVPQRKGSFLPQKPRQIQISPVQQEPRQPTGLQMPGPNVVPMGGGMMSPDPDYDSGRQPATPDPSSGLNGPQTGFTRADMPVPGTKPIIFPQGRDDLQTTAESIFGPGTQASDVGGLLDKATGGEPGASKWDDQIGDYLDMVFGDEASFDPQKELMEEQRDRALRQSMEMMASQGMLGTGAAGGAAHDIYRGAARDMAQARQDWFQQNVQNAAQATQMLFQDSWKNLDFEQQKMLMELQYMYDRKRKYGEDWNDQIGDNEMTIISQMLASDNLGPDGQATLEWMLEQLWGSNWRENLPPSNKDIMEEQIGDLRGGLEKKLKDLGLI